MKQKKQFLTITAGLAALVLVLATPVSALCSFSCTCESSAGEICRNGPFVPDCPTCNQSTCLASGSLYVGHPSCSADCENNGYTTTINGTSGGDTLNGTSANERINGLGGNDTIYGNAGDDTIYAGSGADTVSGGSGDDCMWGEGGNDSLTGNTGSLDFADGGAGTDTCNAESEVSCEI